MTETIRSKDLKYAVEDMRAAWTEKGRAAVCNFSTAEFAAVRQEAKQAVRDFIAGRTVTQRDESLSAIEVDDWIIPNMAEKLFDAWLQGQEK